MTSPLEGSSYSSISLTLDPAVNAFIEGFKWGGSVGTAAAVTYSFPSQNTTDNWSTDPNSGYGASGAGGEPWAAGFAGLTVDQQNAVASALQAWSNVAGLVFIPVADDSATAGDIRVAWTDGGGMTQNTYAYAYVDSQAGHQAIVGDVWLNSNPGGPMLSPTVLSFLPGQEGYNTLIHELGHAIGLDHPFSPANPLKPNAGLTVGQNTLKYTVMAYADAPRHWDAGNDSMYPTTPMLLDIKALQFIYGANMNYRSGDDTYVFNGPEAGSDYYQTVWDAGGNDTIVYNSGVGGLIDLRAGKFSQLGNSIVIDNGLVVQRDTVAIAYDVTIENATGGSGNDTLIGNDANNLLDGGAGVDKMSGGAGNDTYVVDNPGDIVTELAGQGMDTVLSSISYSLVNRNNLENLTLVGNADISATGNGLANVLTGNAGSNLLAGGAGADTLVGGAGNDSYAAGIGDLISEASGPVSGGGADVLEIRAATSGLRTALAAAFDDFSQDLKFSRVNAGKDLRIDLTAGRRVAAGAITVAGMDNAATMVETLRLYNASGSQIATDIDLTSVWAASTATPKRLTLTGGNSAYGALAA